MNYLKVLYRLQSQIDDFPPRWHINMGKAGYLANTTAKRRDAILSFEWFMGPLIEAAEKRSPASFVELIANQNNWAEMMIQTSRRHRTRGVTGEMFIGCFKTLVHTLLEMLEEGNEPLKQKMATAAVIRMWADAFETIIVRDWETSSQKESESSLEHANRRLTLEKCKYENVLDSISELVLMVNGRGVILEANRSARQYFQKDLSSTSILALLGIETDDIKTIFSDYTPVTPLKISLGENLFFQCAFVPLNEVSMVSNDYLAVLKDITAHVKQSDILETKVAERTSQLLKKKNQLEEMNVTLRTVMKSVDKERESFQKNIDRTVTRTLIPTLNTIRKEKSGDIRNAYLSILENQLFKLTQGGENSRQAILLKLTPMEMKICGFIQAGVSSQEIADALNLSIVTIQTHRRSIRRKLNLQNRKVNLLTFLNQAG